VVAKTGAPENSRVAERLAEWLANLGVRARFSKRTSEQMGVARSVPSESIPRGCDLIIVAGGDGTLLSMARTAAPRGVPILGVNLGSLGFLTELQPEELFRVLAQVVAGHYEIEERHLLRVRLFRGRRKVREHAALNDVVLSKSALARMVNLEVQVDGEIVADYTSDGLIVSTATGSTAYSLSAGGPILDPRVRAFIVTPICPHTMSYRPLVVPGNVEVRAGLKTHSDEEVFVTLDGQIGYPLLDGETVVVHEHPTPVRLVRVSGRTFFEVLRRKLRWGAR
jgi:NAD+ kinase